MAQERPVLPGIMRKPDWPCLNQGQLARRPVEPVNETDLDAEMIVVAAIGRRHVGLMLLLTRSEADLHEEVAVDIEHSERGPRIWRSRLAVCRLKALLRGR